MVCKKPVLKKKPAPRKVTFKKCLIIDFSNDSDSSMSLPSFAGHHLGSMKNDNATNSSDNELESIGSPVFAESQDLMATMEQ